MVRFAASAAEAAGQRDTAFRAAFTGARRAMPSCPPLKEAPTFEEVAAILGRPSSSTTLSPKPGCEAAHDCARRLSRALLADPAVSEAELLTLAEKLLSSLTALHDDAAAEAALQRELAAEAQRRLPSPRIALLPEALPDGAPVSAPDGTPDGTPLVPPTQNSLLSVLGVAALYLCCDPITATGVVLVGVAVSLASAPAVEEPVPPVRQGVKNVVKEVVEEVPPPQEILPDHASLPFHPGRIISIKPSF